MLGHDYLDRSRSNTFTFFLCYLIKTGFILKCKVIAIYSSRYDIVVKKRIYTYKAKCVTIFESSTIAPSLAVNTMYRPVVYGRRLAVQGRDVVDDSLCQLNDILWRVYFCTMKK